MNRVTINSTDGNYSVTIYSGATRNGEKVDEITINGKTILLFPVDTNHQYRVQFFNRKELPWVFIGTRGDKQYFINLTTLKCYTNNLYNCYNIYPNPSGTIFAIEYTIYDFGQLAFYDFSDPEKGFINIPTGFIINSYQLETSIHYNSYNIKWIDDDTMIYTNETEFCISRNQEKSEIHWDKWKEIPDEDKETRLQYRTTWKLKDGKMRCIDIKPSNDYKKENYDTIESEYEEREFLHKIKKSHPQYLALKRAFPLDKIKVNTCTNDDNLIRNSQIPLEKHHFQASINKNFVKCYPEKIVVTKFDTWPNTTNTFSSLEEAISFIKN